MSIPAAFIGVIIIWSTTPLAIQWSSADAGFLFGVTARMLLGLLVCLLVLRLIGAPLRWHREARRTYVAAGVGIYGAMTSVYWSAQYIPSGWIAVIFGLSPLITSLLAVWWLNEGRLSLLRVTGLLSGVGGLFIMFGNGATLGPGVAYGVLGVFLSVVLHSVSAVWVRAVGGNIPALSVTAGGLSVAAPLFVLTWFIFDGQWPDVLSERTRFSIVYLAVFGSVLGFFGYFYLLRKMEVTQVNLLTLITPVTALLLGHLLNDEVLMSQIWFGVGLITAGLFFYQWDLVLARRPG